MIMPRPGFLKTSRWCFLHYNLPWGPSQPLGMHGMMEVSSDKMDLDGLFQMIRDSYPTVDDLTHVDQIQPSLTYPMFNAGVLTEILGLRLFVDKFY